MSKMKRIRTSDTLNSPLDDSACHMVISGRTGRTSRWLLMTYAQYESLLLSLNQPLHRQIFNLFPRQAVKQVTKLNSDLQLRKHFSPVDRSNQGSLCLALSNTLLAAMFPQWQRQKDNFWHSCHNLLLSLFQVPFKRLTLSGNQQSLNTKRREVAPRNFQDGSQSSGSVGYHPVPEMKVWSGKGPASLQGQSFVISLLNTEIQGWMNAPGHSKRPWNLVLGQTHTKYFPTDQPWHFSFFENRRQLLRFHS